MKGCALLCIALSILCNAEAFQNSFRRVSRYDANTKAVRGKFGAKHTGVTSINISYGVRLQLREDGDGLDGTTTAKTKTSSVLSADEMLPGPDNDITDSTSTIEDSPERNITLALSQFKPFLDIAVPFFKGDPVARKSLIGVVALTLLNSGISVVFSYISKDFYNALNARDETLFYEKIEYFFAALLIAVPVSVYYRFLREKLSLYWREALSNKVLDKYYADRTYYVVECLREVDNPDQRITEDVRAFTRTSLDFFISLFTAAVDLLSFAAILYQIYPGLFLAIIAYAGAGSVITTKLGQELVSKNYQRLRREADFRFGLIRTRENAEAIAFYDPEATSERKSINSTFQRVLDNQLDIINIQKNLEFFTTAYRYMPQILPSLIVAPMYFRHEIELGAISQSYGAFNHVLGDFSIIINSFEQLSAFSAGLTRLTSFLEKISVGGWNDSLNKAKSDTGESANDGNISIGIQMSTFRSDFGLEGQGKEDFVLQCRDLSVFTPDGGRAIIGTKSGADADKVGGTDGGLDVDIRRGDKVIVVGNSGCGKSSLVRAISGLWQVGTGQVKWNEDLVRLGVKEATLSVSAIAEKRTLSTAPTGVFFLPQRPYNILGTLRQQIVYPSTLEDGARGDDVRLLQILDQVKLDGLAERLGDGDPNNGLGCELDWSKVLSLGEQQRLAFARVLYNKPQVVVLDESTSALDLDTEAAMYALLDDMDSPGPGVVTFISIGHRPSLLRYHNKRLILRGPGTKAEMGDIVDKMAPSLYSQQG